MEYVRKYQLMVAARHQDIKRLREMYEDCGDVILSIDGIQPEKGHETLYVVRELRKQRVWFAEALLSSSHAEIRKLIQRVKQIAHQLSKPVRGWVSDKQDAFVTTIRAEFPNKPHRYCNNHFLWDLAKPVLDKDSHLKVHMRKKIRGLRSIEKATLAEIDSPSKFPERLSREQNLYAAQIVLDYCAAVRGILNDNHGGPLTPPGWRMANVLATLCQSLEWNLAQPSTPIRSKLRRLERVIQWGLTIYNQEKAAIAEYTKAIQQVFDLLHQDNGTCANRLAEFHRLTNSLTRCNFRGYLLFCALFILICSTTSLRICK